MGWLALLALLACTAALAQSEQFALPNTIRLTPTSADTAIRHSKMVWISRYSTR